MKRLVLLGLGIAFFLSGYCQQIFNNVVTDADGNAYDAVIIGNQVWMTENLKTTKFNDGTPIPLVTDNNNWSNLTTPAYSWLNNNYALNGDEYGALYNWYSVNSNKLCPEGWHVPGDDEWTTLENFLIANSFNYDNSNYSNKIAKAISSDETWTFSSNIGAIGNPDYPEKRNITGFSALPGGYRNENGNFLHEGPGANWWTATAFNSTCTWYRGLIYYYSGTIRYEVKKQNGFSVRCLCDQGSPEFLSTHNPNPPSAMVPTLSFWKILILVGGFLVTGGYFLRKRTPLSN